MGIQQILMIVLSILILSSMFLVTLRMIKSASVRTNRNFIKDELSEYASEVIYYYNLPQKLSGGGLEIKVECDTLIASYLKFDKDDDTNYKIHTTNNATYHLNVYSGYVDIIAYGKEIGNDKQNVVEFKLTVNPSMEEQYNIEIKN